MELTRTQKTEQDYLIRAERLKNKFYKETGRDLFLDPVLFVEWIKNLFRTLKPSSIRQYKASLVFYLKNNNAPIDIIEEIQDFLAVNDKPIEPRTSAKKSKKVNKKVLNKIMVRLSVSKSKYKRFIMLMILSNLYFGFRPHEWLSAVYDEKNNAIIIKNGKNSNGRANGDTRSIAFPRGHEAIDYAKAFIEEIHYLVENNKDWERVYNGAAKVLRDAQKKIRIDKITPYDTRHQVSANYKASGFSREDIADLMGHKSIRTASLHYAKKSSGHKIKKTDIPKYISKDKLKAVIGIKNE